MPRNRAVMEAEILRVAAEIFSEKGYRAATLDDLASAAGISRATFYSYFPSKEELLCRLYRLFSSVTQAEIKRIVEQELPAQEKLRRIIRFQVTYVAEHKPLVQVFFSEIFNLPPKMVRAATQANREYSHVVEQVVEEGVRQGVFTPMNPKFFTYALMGALTWLYRWYQPEGPQTPAGIAEEFIRMLEGGYLNRDQESGEKTLTHEVRELRHVLEQVKETILVRPPRNLTRRSPHANSHKKQKFPQDSLEEETASL